MCFVWIWEQTAIISLYRINWLFLITETECVYCAVRAACLNTIGDNPSFYNCKWNLMRSLNVRGLLRRVLTRPRFEEGILLPKHKSRTLFLPIYCLSRFFLVFSLKVQILFKGMIAPLKEHHWRLLCDVWSAQPMPTDCSSMPAKNTRLFDVSSYCS